MELEPGIVRQVSALVDGWDTEVLDAITGHLTTHEADLLARVFAATRGYQAGALVMVSHMQQSMTEGSAEDWAEDARLVRELGWLDDVATWNRLAEIWSLPPFADRIIALADAASSR